MLRMTPFLLSNGTSLSSGMLLYPMLRKTWEKKNTDKSVSEHLASTYFARRSQKNKPNEKEKHKGVDSFHRKISNNSPLTGIITNFFTVRAVSLRQRPSRQWKKNSGKKIDDCALRGTLEVRRAKSRCYFIPRVPHRALTSIFFSEFFYSHDTTSQKGRNFS